MAGKERIGFIGAGMMGSGMCHNLLKAGYPLTVIANRNREPIDALVGEGAIEAKNLGDLVAASDVVMVCVNSADTVRELISGMSDALRPGMLVIDITTSLPDVTRELAAGLAERDITLIDAPVVAGPAQAMQGKLGTFIGGSDEAVARAMPIVSTYSEDVAHFGPTGSAHTAKLLNNFLTVGLRQLVTHSFRAARRNNIDMAKLYAMVAKGAAGSRTVDQFVQGAIVGDYSGNKFSISNCYKDMSYAEAIFADDPDGAAIQQAMVSAYARLVEAGHGDRLASEMLNPEVEASTRS